MMYKLDPDRHRRKITLKLSPKDYALVHAIMQEVNQGIYSIDKVFAHCRCEYLFDLERGEFERFSRVLEQIREGAKR